MLKEYCYLRIMKLLSFSCLAIAFMSCSHYYYVPNVQNVPLLREKNEYRLSGSYGIGMETNCLEAQGAYAITNNLGIMSNFISAWGIENSEESWAKGSYVEAAIGYYKPLQKSAVFEVYGGGGWGNQHHLYRNTIYDESNPAHSILNAGTSEESFIKLFIQPSIGKSFNWLDIAISTRFNKLSFFKIENQINQPLNENNFEELSEIERTKNYFFLEPAITIRAGWKYFKVQVQGSLASYLNNEHYPFDPYNISIGLTFTMAKRYLSDSPK